MAATRKATFIDAVLDADMSEDMRKVLLVLAGHADADGRIALVDDDGEQLLLAEAAVGDEQLVDAPVHQRRRELGSGRQLADEVVVDASA